MKRRILTVGLLVLVGIAALYATGQTEAAAPAVDEQLEFTWYIHYDWATHYADWNMENPIAAWVTENRNVKASWITSGGAAQQKLSTMIVSNDMPDVITIDRGPELESLVANGALTPLDPYYENYPHFQEWGGDTLVNLLRSTVDQQWYGMPSWYTNTNYPLGNSGFIVNLLHYRALGEPELDTLDDMLDFARDVQDEFPDVTPVSISGSLSVFYTVFGEERITDLYNMHLYRDGDELKSILDDPAFVDAMVFANEMYREGLIDGDEFAMTAEKRDEQFNNGRIGIASTNDALNGSRDHHRAFREINPEGGYMTIYPPIREGLDRDKVYASSYALVGWNVTTITRSAEEPERIYEFLDWLTGPEGQAVSLYGPPGRYWESWKQYRGVDVVDLETPLFMERDEEAYAEMLDSWHFNWVPNGAWQHAMSRYEYDLFPPGPDEWKNLDYAAITRSHAIATDEYAGILPDPTSDAGIIYSSADEIVNKQTLRAILADSEAEARAAIEEARAQLSQIGFAGALAEINENWKGRLELMNM